MQLVLNLQHHQHLRCGVVGLLSWNLEPSAISSSCNNNHMDCERTGSSCIFIGYYIMLVKYN